MPGRDGPDLGPHAQGRPDLGVCVMLLASHFQLGTHFDNSGVMQFTFAGQEHLVEPRSWGQYRVLVLMPQLTFWMGVTLAAGLVLGLPAYWLASRRCRATSAATLTD